MHTGNTDNYALTQFASTDKPAWLVDYNEDMRKIDAGMKGNADAIEALGESVGQEGTDITELKERMATAEADIDAAQEAIGTGELETEVKNLIGASNELLGLIHGNDNDITALQQGLASVGDAIDGVAQVAYTIANVYDSTQTYTVGSYAIYQNTLYKCITAITVGEAFNPAKWTSVKVMNEVGAGGGSYTAGAGIDITNNVISFDDGTAPYDNTDSGLDATTVKGAIDEVNEKISGTRTPDITITGNGAKTVSQILTEIADSVDISKLSMGSHIVLRSDTNNITMFAHISVITATAIHYNYNQLSAGNVYIYNALCAKSTSGTASQARSIAVSTTGAVTNTDESSIVVGNGEKFEVFY